MNVLDAARAVARHYPGGAAALGARMGKTNLADELNPNLTRSKLGLADAVEMQLLANDYRVLYAMAAELRHYPPAPMPEGVDGADDRCLKQLGALAKECAEVMQTGLAALADNRVTDVERASVETQCQDLIAVVMGLMQAIRAKNEELRATAPGAGRVAP